MDNETKNDAANDKLYVDLLHGRINQAFNESTQNGVGGFVIGFASKGETGTPVLCINGSPESVVSGFIRALISITHNAQDAVLADIAKMAILSAAHLITGSHIDAAIGDLNKKISVMNMKQQMPN